MALSYEQAKEYLTRRISLKEKYEDLLKFPRYIEIETVNACNARCPMCTINDWDRRYSAMTDELFQKVATEICQHTDEVKRVVLYRDGEPLLDKKLHEKVAILKKGGIKTTSISTNVALLSEKKAVDLLESGIDHVILSIDSLVKDVYESIRVRCKFEEVMENAHRFIQLRNKIRPQTQVFIRMIRQKSNLNEWPEYQKYWSKFVSPQDRVYYHNIFNWGGQLKGFEPVSQSYELELPCVALWSLFVIFCNGDVPLCNVDYNKKYPTGSVVTHSIQELWQSKIMNQRREWHLTGKKNCISLCENCNVWDEAHDSEHVSNDYASAHEIPANV